MKNLILLSAILYLFSCQRNKEDITPVSNTPKEYLPSNDVFFNPERGFYKFFETHSQNFNLLNENSLNEVKAQKMSLIYKGYYLDDFVESPISESYLNNLQSDFNLLRKVGLKIILRFAYTVNPNLTKKDASKAWILKHIAQLAPYLKNNADVIYVVNAGFIGTWGEWYFTSQNEFGIPPAQPNYEPRKEVVEALLKALPDSRMIQLRTPNFKRRMYDVKALAESKAFDKSSLSRIGHHNDCFLASIDDSGTYLDIANEYSYLEEETKFLAMGGETCKSNPPRSNCPIAVSEMKKFHWSFLNIDYHPEVLNNWRKGENCYDEILRNLGYRFQLKSIKYPSDISKTKKFNFEILLDNKGYASLFNQRKAYLILKNSITGAEIKLLLNSDPRKWLGTDILIKETLALPNDAPIGKYKLFFSIPDMSEGLQKRVDYSIRFANENIWESQTGYNNLNIEVNITD